MTTHTVINICGLHISQIGLQQEMKQKCATIQGE